MCGCCARRRGQHPLGREFNSCSGVVGGGRHGGGGFDEPIAGRGEVGVAALNTWDENEEVNKDIVVINLVEETILREVFDKLLEVPCDLAPLDRRLDRSLSPVAQ